MDDPNALTQTLLAVSAGARALRYAAQAATAVGPVDLPPNFAYRALIAPLSRLEGLVGEELPPLPPRPRARRRPRPRQKKPRVALPPAPIPAQGKGLPDPTDLDGFDERIGVWDPEELSYSPLADPVMEASSCRALLLEVVRRAAYDWVLYRQSSKLQNKVLAESAFHWLFVEEPGSSAWSQRRRGEKELTAFLSICDVIGLDPERVRARIRQLTERDIMGAGRPAERRKSKQGGEEALTSDEHSVFDVNIDELPNFDPMFATGG